MQKTRLTECSWIQSKQILWAAFLNGNQYHQTSTCPMKLPHMLLFVFMYHDYSYMHSRGSGWDQPFSGKGPRMLILRSRFLIVECDLCDIDSRDIHIWYAFGNLQIRSNQFESNLMNICENQHINICATLANSIAYLVLVVSSCMLDCKLSRSLVHRGSSHSSHCALPNFSSNLCVRGTWGHPACWIASFRAAWCTAKSGCGGHAGSSCWPNALHDPRIQGCCRFATSSNDSWFPQNI